MQPTLGVIMLFLSHKYHVDAEFLLDDDIAFSEWRVYDEERPEPGVLYLVREPLPNDRKWEGRLAIGLYPPPKELPRDFCYLQLRERSGRARSMAAERRFIGLVNAMQEASRRFDALALHVERECGTNANFFELLRMCEQETGLAYVLVDRNLHYLAASDSFALANPWFKLQESSMDVDMVNELMADEAFRQAIDHREAFFFHYESYGVVDTACFNIFVDDRYEARLLVQSVPGAKVFGQLSIARLVGERIADVFKLYSAERRAQTVDRDFSEAIRSLLHAPPTKIAELREKLAAHGWRIGHSHLVHVFSFMQPENESLTRRYYEATIERLFPGCCVLAEGDLICCVRNLSLESSGSAASQQSLVVFLRENLCWAGTSREFDDICRLYSHYEEARCALKLGIASDSTEWHFRFEDYVLDHVLDRASDGLDDDALFHGAYTTLKGYDEKHGTSLLETVCCFMECRYNVTHAARHLGIHRSSMLSRLERIDELTGIDWDSWDERLHLALTFSLANRSNKM